MEMPTTSGDVYFLEASVLGIVAKALSVRKVNGILFFDW